MITVTSAQLDAWLAAFMYPMARILALLAAAPVFNNTALSAQTRIIFGIAFSLVLAPALPDMPAVPPGSWQGMAILAQQILIGTVFGLTLRVVFSAVGLAGDLMGLQMGLSFASFYDPTSASQMPVVSNFLGLFGTLLFISLDGHLLMLSVLAESFTLLPVGLTPFSARGYAAMLTWAATIFSSGLMLALPIIAALLITNISFGVLTRIAPQLNIFAVGFPVTLAAGFIVLLLSLPYFGAALERLYGSAFIALAGIMRAGGTLP